MINKMKVACFSGHRKLPQNCTEIQGNLEKVIVELIEKGVVFFGCGGAVGFDQLAAIAVLKLKEKYPQIKLVMVLPCPPKVQSLKWSNIDFENGIVRVSKALQRVSDKSGRGKTKIAITSPKSKTSIRDIPLPSFILDILKQEKRSSGFYILSGTSKPIELRTMQNRFKAVLKNCGIRNANFHLMRHTFACHNIQKWAESDITVSVMLPVLSKYLGHTSISATQWYLRITEETYPHIRTVCESKLGWMYRDILKFTTEEAESSDDKTD